MKAVLFEKCFNVNFAGDYALDMKFFRNSSNCIETLRNYKKINLRCRPLMQKRLNARFWP